MNATSSLEKIIATLSRPSNRFLVVAVCFFLYFAVYIGLQPIIGSAIGMVAIFPVLIAAWLYGKWAGIIFALFSYVMDYLLSLLFGWENVVLIFKPAGLLGVAATIIAGFVTGWMGDTNREHRSEIQKNDLLMEERQRYSRFLAILNDILLAAMETDDMTAMLKVLAQRTGELFDADDCYITRWDEQTRKTIPEVAYGALSENYTRVHQFMPDEVTLTAAVMDAGHAIAIEDMRTTHYVTPNVAEEFPNVSALGLPLISGTRKLGAVILGFNQVHQFSEIEIQQGELAARQISLAVTKAILLDEARQRVNELAGLHHISQAFSLHEDAPHTFRMLTGILAEQMHAEVCVILLYNPDTREIRAQSPAFGIPEELIAALHYPLGALSWQPDHPPVFLANSIAEMPLEFIPLARSFNIDSVLAAALQDEQNRWMGVLLVANKPGGFTEQDRHLLQVFSSQVVIVIQNTHLLGVERKRARQLSVLHALALAATNAGHEDALIEQVTHMIGERLYPDNFGILLVDDKQAELYLHSSYHLGDHEEPLRVPLGLGITGTVARSGKPRRVNDTSKTPEYLGLYPQTRSELCVPLKVEEHVIGVINVENSRINAFTEEDEELLDIIAGQLSTAIQRLRTEQAELVKTEQLKRSNSLIRALSQVNARAAVVADLDGVIQTLGSELSILGMRCMVALTDSENKNLVIQYVSLPERTLQVLEHSLKFRLHNAVLPISSAIPVPEGESKGYIIQDLPAALKAILPNLSRASLTRISRSAGILETTSVCYLPLVAEGRPVGILWLWGEGIHENDLPTISLFASQIAGVIQKARLLAEVSRLAVTDELTGIFNRRHFFDLARKMFDHALDNHLPLSALIIDLDHFKQFNDRYGHAIGDKVLHGAAALIKSALRGQDIMGRYGGEEFSILLPGTDTRNAIKVAQRIITAVTETPIQTEAGGLDVHLSIGVAELDGETPSLHALINSADQAMYVAKEAGGDRVVAK